MTRRAIFDRPRTLGKAYAPRVEFRVLGSIEVRRGTESLPVGGPKQRSVLALLIANVGRPVSLDTIVDGVYGEEAPGGARHSVQTYISSFRREIGDVVLRQAGGYMLRAEPSEIDAVAFAEMVRLALPMVDTDPEAAADDLRRALGIWRGHPYADVDGRALFSPEITRLNELRLAALEARVDADLALGRHREMVGELEALAAEFPLQERLRGQLMTALYRSGRQTEALRAFDRARDYLADEVGLEPSAELRALEQRILDQDPDLDLTVPPSVTKRAVVVIEMGGGDAFERIGPEERERRVDEFAEAAAVSVGDHGGKSIAQRGSAIYATFDTIGEALVSAIEVVRSDPEQATVRVAVDIGEVEIEESGDVTGPPVRRSAGMVAAAHPGQVVLSYNAHAAVGVGGDPGWVTKTLGTHAIHGFDVPQQVFQLLVDGQQASFPPLLTDVAPPPLPADRRAVAGYELRRPIRSDFAGTAYRAYQPSVGREVLVTVIDPAWANDPDFVRRFEVETQMVARLQHPNIVPLLDYWRDPTGAYLVEPLVGTATLAEHLRDRSVSAEEGWRLAAAIGGALSYANSRGVVHGTLEPAMVVVDSTLNGYLSAAGFLARLVNTTAGGAGPRGAQSGRLASHDANGLALIMSQLPDFSDGEVESTIGDAVLNGSSMISSEFDSVDDLMALFASHAERSGARTFTQTRNPYKGLDAFGAADAADFYGRDDAVEQLRSLLEEQRFVAVVGPTGSGKSSLVRAGLVPSVVKDGLAGFDGWVVADMFPGSYPFMELESAMARVAVTDPGGLLDELERDERGLARVIKRVIPVGTRLLLVIDQFEELFTLTRDAQARERLLRALVTLASDDRSDARIVVTLRADFFDRPLEYPALGNLMKQGLFALTNPSPPQLVDAIRRPARGVGVEWDDDLVDQIVHDVAEAPGTLPLLQYALTELFDRRASDVITQTDYRAGGGVFGTLGARAEETFDRLDQEAQELARQLFLRLVTVHSGTPPTRRRVRTKELNTLGVPDHVQAVLSAFGAARLLTFDRDPLTREPTVEPAHEALLTNWPRLVRWTVDADEDLLLRRRFDDACEEWIDRDRDPNYLLGGGRLAQFEVWANTTALALTASERDFLHESTTLRLQLTSRSRRVRRRILIGLSAAAVISIGLAVVASANASQANSNSEIARSRELTASAINLLDDDPELSLLLSIEGAATAEPAPGALSAVHEALAAHRKILTYQWPADQVQAGDLSARLSPDGQRLVASAGSPYVEVVDVDSGSKVWDHEFPGSGTARAVFNHDGTEVIVTYGHWSADGSQPDADTASSLGVHRLDAVSGDEVSFFPTGPCGVVTRPEFLTVAGTSDRSYLLTQMGDDPTCSFRGAYAEAGTPPPQVLLDLDTGAVRRTVLQPPAFVSGDASYLLELASDPSFSVLVDLRTGAEVVTMEGEPAGLSSSGDVAMTVKPDHIVTWRIDDAVANPSQAAIEEFSRFDPRGVLAWLSPDGAVIATTASGSGVRLWDALSGFGAGRWQTGLGSNDQLAYSEDSTRVVVSEVFGGTASVLDISPHAEVASVKLCPAVALQSGSIQVRGDTIAVLTVCDNNYSMGTQWIVDADSYDIRAAIADQSGMRTALSPDGGLIASQLGERPNTVSQIVLRNTADGGVEQVLTGLCQWVDGGEKGPDCVDFPDTPFADWPWDLTFSNDQSLVAMGGQNTDAVVVWDVATGDIVATPTVVHASPGPDNVLSVAFSPEDDRIAASFVFAPKELWMISTNDWSPISRYVAPQGADTLEPPSHNLMFTPDGATLIGTDFSIFGEGRIVFMDGTSLAHLAEIPDAHAGGVAGLALNETGTLLASAGIDGFVRVWDVETRGLLQQIPISTGEAGVGGVAFLSDTRLVATSMGNGELRVVTMDPGELLDIARARVTRSFTETECALYRIDPCPTLEELKSG